MGPQAENIFHLCFSGGPRSNNLIVLQEPEGTADRCVLETGGRLQGGNFACEDSGEAERSIRGKPNGIPG